MKKVIILIIAIILLMKIGFSVNVCGVNIAQGGGDFRNSAGINVFYLDHSGNIVIRGEKDTFASSNALQWFSTSSNLKFGSTKSKFEIGIEKTSPLNTGFVFNNGPGGEVIASLQENGKIYSKGYALYDQRGRGSDINNLATCNSDGQNYCYAGGNRDGQTDLTTTTSNIIKLDNRISQIYAEDRDYFCDITGYLQGTCTYDVKNTDYCDDDFTPYYTCSGSSLEYKVPGCNNGRCTQLTSKTQSCGSSFCQLNSIYYTQSCTTSPTSCPVDNPDCTQTTICNRIPNNYCSIYIYKGCDREANKCYTRTITTNRCSYDSPADCSDTSSSSTSHSRRI